MKLQAIEELTLLETSRLIRSRDLSPVELTEGFYERIDRLNSTLNAYLTLAREQALASARSAEEEILNGRYRGPLHGIPFSIKDNLATQGIRTTAGSKVLRDWIPDFDATVVKKLKEAGAIILGKTNMDEWALGGSTTNPHYGPTRNPWDTQRIAGGSSGGSGAAVAAGMCMASIGTDSAMSVRNPASICGIVGLKATYGRVSRFGGVQGTGGFSTDHCGILAKNVRDSALILEVIAGQDPLDPLSSPVPVDSYSDCFEPVTKGLKIGVLKGYYDDILVDEVKQVFEEAAQEFELLGMKIQEVSIPHMDLFPAIRNCTSRAENVSSHLPYLRTRPRDYGPRALQAYIAALLIPAEAYITAQRVRRILCQEFEEVLEEVQALLVPTVATPTPSIEEFHRGIMEVNGTPIELQDGRGPLNSLCTSPFNVTGLPAISIPCGFSSSGLPLGLQVVGNAFEESVVLGIAHAYERKAEWYKNKPPLL